MRIRLSIFATMFLVFVVSLIFMQSVSSSHLLPENSPIQRTYPCNPNAQCLEQDHNSTFYCVDFGFGYRWYDIRNIFSGSIENIRARTAICNSQNFNACSTFAIANSCIGVVDPIGGSAFRSNRLSGFCNPNTNRWNFYDEADFNRLCQPVVANLQSCNRNSECIVRQGDNIFYCVNVNNNGFKWYEAGYLWQGSISAGTATCNSRNFNACSTFAIANACGGVADPLSPSRSPFNPNRLSGFCNPNANKWNFYDEASFENLCITPSQSTITPPAIPPTTIQVPPAIPPAAAPPTTPSTTISQTPGNKGNTDKFSVSSFSSFNRENYFNVYTKVRNLGSKKSDIKIRLYVPELNIYEARSLNLGSKQTKWSSFSFYIPQGKYVVKLEVSNGKSSQVKYLEAEKK